METSKTECISWMYFQISPQFVTDFYSTAFQCQTHRRDPFKFQFITLPRISKSTSTHNIFFDNSTIDFWPEKLFRHRGLPTGNGSHLFVEKFLQAIFSIFHLQHTLFITFWVFPCGFELLWFHSYFLLHKREFSSQSSSKVWVSLNLNNCFEERGSDFCISKLLIHDSHRFVIFIFMYIEYVKM